MAIVRQNVIARFSLTCLLALLAIPRVITLWLAVSVGDMGLSLVVILNALRIGGKELIPRTNSSLGR